jgi:hypothetical protein
VITANVEWSDPDGADANLSKSIPLQQAVPAESGFAPTIGSARLGPLCRPSVSEAMNQQPEAGAPKAAVEEQHRYNGEPFIR